MTTTRRTYNVGMDFFMAVMFVLVMVIAFTTAVVLAKSKKKRDKKQK